jgi:oxygen-independent coproporphyrinogen-3 oxidase
MIAERYGDLVSLTGDYLAVEPRGRPLTRIIASALDTHLSDNERFSHAS